jgi:hypothetical protein
MTMSRDDMIDILWSKEAIRDLAQRYCRACDRADFVLLESVYHPGALDEHGFNRTLTAREFLDAVPDMWGQMQELQHNVTNHIIDVDGDYGEGEVYVIAYHRYTGEDGPTLLVSGGRYLDKYERREGRWKIAHRRCVDDWSVVLPAPPATENKFTEGGLERGCAGTADPSYAFFKSLAR